METVEFSYVLNGIEQGDVVSFGGKKKYICNYVKKMEDKMPKYKTKKIDYTGCHPVIAEHLKRGEAILCHVWDDERFKEDKEWIFQYLYEECQKRCYLDEDEIYWKHAEPVETKTKVKKASEIIKWFEDRGCFQSDINGIWDEGDPKGWAFLPVMFRSCGMVPNKNYRWHPDWLEEVDE